MEPILTRCGYRCDLCLAFKPNIAKHPTDRQKLSDGWYKYFGFRIAPADLCCDGCMSDNPKLIDTSCPVRPCALERGLDNCAQCEQYMCDKLKTRIVSLAEVRQRTGFEVPEHDYICFIRPYENTPRLDAYRSSKRSETPKS